MNAESTDLSHLSHTPLPLLLLQTTCSFWRVTTECNCHICSIAALHHNNLKCSDNYDAHLTLGTKCKRRSSSYRCTFARVIIKVIKPWHLLANDLAQLVNIFKEHVVVGHGPTRPGNLHFPQKSVQMVNISEDCSVDTSEYQECAAKRHADSRRYRSPNSDKQEMIDSCRF